VRVRGTRSKYSLGKGCCLLVEGACVRHAIQILMYISLSVCVCVCACVYIRIKRRSKHSDEDVIYGHGWFS
jgi:hypothetical protein